MYGGMYIRFAAENYIKLIFSQSHVYLQGMKNSIMVLIIICPASFDKLKQNLDQRPQFWLSIHIESYFKNNLNVYNLRDTLEKV